MRPGGYGADSGTGMEPGQLVGNPARDVCPNCYLSSIRCNGKHVGRPV